jgi:nucleoside-diphosphate-sugar epimerase
MMASTYVVTGSSGFIGRALVSSLGRRGLPTLGVGRTAMPGVDVAVGEIDGRTEWRHVLHRGDCVVHTAGRAHVLRDTAVDPIASFRRVNVEGTRRLAMHAAEVGVRRLVFISSIGVNGVSTDGRPAFASTDLPAPVEPYGQSKWEAELQLRDIEARTGLEVVIVRPPLVYGPGVQANFRRLIKLAQSGLPLPLGGIENRRSLVALDNLLDLLIVCAERPVAAGKTMLVSDDEDLSTPDLLRRIGNAMNVPVRLFPVPRLVLLQGSSLVGRRGEAERLLGSLQVDIGDTRRLLDWTPPITLDEGLRRTVV